MSGEKPTRCKHCWSTAEPRNGYCPVCGIEPGKERRNLSPSEKRARAHARGIRLVAICHLIGAVGGAMMLPELPARGAVTTLVVISALLGYGLFRYALPAYRAAVVFYFLIGMVNVISIQHGLGPMLGILLALLALYLIGNKTSKAIFERRLPEELQG